MRDVIYTGTYEKCQNVAMAEYNNYEELEIVNVAEENGELICNVVAYDFKGSYFRNGGDY